MFYDGQLFTLEQNPLCPIKYDLSKLKKSDIANPFDENGLFYKIIAVEDFSETESVIMFKCHHVLADGMSLIGLIASM